MAKITGSRGSTSGLAGEMRVRIRWGDLCRVLILAWGLVFLGCFEDPVQETVEIELLPDDEVRITARTELLSISREQNDAAWRRLELQRALLLEGKDPWTRRFETLRPATETYSWEKYGEELAEVTRSAIVESDQLGLFFADTALSVFVTGSDDWRELAIYPGTSNRASNEQRLALERRMVPWTESVSSYLSSLETLYVYLDQNEQRARDVLVHVFGDFLAEEDVDNAVLTDEELAMVDDLHEAMTLAWEVLEVGGDAAYSLNEISHLVHDPFPSDLEIILPVEPVEVEGFERDEDRLVVRRTGLWEAFDQLSSRWATPDLLTLWIDAAVNQSRIDPDQIAAEPRSVTTPSASDIREVLEGTLRPEPRYRVRWRTP